LRMLRRWQTMRRRVPRSPMGGAAMTAAWTRSCRIACIKTASQEFSHAALSGCLRPIPERLGVRRNLLLEKGTPTLYVRRSRASGQFPLSAQRQLKPAAIPDAKNEPQPELFVALMICSAVKGRVSFAPSLLGAGAALRRSRSLHRMSTGSLLVARETRTARYRSSDLHRG
jgi:hypothetical protein